MTPPEEVQQLARDLLMALGLSVPCGSVTLNFNQDDLESVRTETFQRVVKPLRPERGVDRRQACGA